jgi:hypothetical protein
VAPINGPALSPQEKALRFCLLLLLLLPLLLLPPRFSLERPPFVLLLRFELRVWVRVAINSSLAGF